MDGLRELPAWKKLALELESGTAEIQRQRKERNERVVARRLEKMKENKRRRIDEMLRRMGAKA